MLRYLTTSALVSMAVLLAGPATAQTTTGLTDTTIKVGVPGPFTGNASSYSKSQLGIVSYYNWVNENGGVNGRKIEPIQVDTACSETTGLTAARKLIHDDRVFLINGISCSGVGLAIKPLVSEAKVPLVINQAVNQNISAPVDPYIFHGVPTSYDASVSIVEFAMSRPDEPNIAIVSHSNEWGKGYRDPQVEHLKAKFDLDPIADLTMERGSTDATPQVLQLRNSGANFVILNLYEAETAIFLRDMKKFGVEMTAMGGFGTDLENTLKRTGDMETVENYCVLHMFVGTLDSPAMAKWGDIIHASYPKEELTAFSFVGMGSAIAVVEALKNAGEDLSRERFIEEMEKLKDFDTGILAGKITFSEDDHQGVKESAAACFVDGKPTLFRSWGVPLDQ